MRYLMMIVLMSLIGGFLSAFAMFFYRAYILASSGANLDKVPLPTMLLDVMELDRYAIYGLAAGALVGVVWVISSLVSRLRLRQPSSQSASDGSSFIDADRAIKSMRERKAREYLAQRKANGS